MISPEMTSALAYFASSELAAFRDRLAPVWQQRPALFKRPFSRPLADESEFLALLERWGSEVRAGKQDGEVLLNDAGALPAGDRTLRALEERLDACWPADWYAYMPDGVQEFNPAIWERFIEIGRVVIDLNGGLPPGGFKLDMFFGRYSRTPTGIHLDSSDNLAFVTRGPKRMLFWPGGRFDSIYKYPVASDPTHEGAMTGRYEDHLADAVDIVAEAGDVIYWPKEYWHIGVSEKGWSGMITAPMYWSGIPRTLATRLLNSAMELPGEIQPLPMQVAAAAGAASVLPPALEQLVRSVKAQVEANLDREARLNWARFVTAYGFTMPPALASRPSLHRASRVRVEHPIAAVPLDDLAIVALGRYKIVALPSLIALPQVLEAGTGHDVGSLVDRFAAGEASAEALVLDVLADLVAFRALTIVSPPIA